MIDATKQPDVDYDEGCLTISWLQGNEMVSVRIADGSLIGTYVSAEPPRATSSWKIELPRGLVKVDETVMEAKT